MSEDPKTFDLISALTGRSYPEETVTVFLNEQLMYTLGKLEEWSVQNPHKSEEYEKARKELLADFAEEAIKVTVRGVPRHVLQALGVKFRDEFKPKKNALTGKEEFPDDADETFEKWMWERYIVKFENAEGGIQVSSPEVIEAFRAQAPQSTLKAVGAAIEELRVAAETGYVSATDKESGFESLVSSPDFS